MKRFLIYPSPESDPTGFVQIFKKELFAEGYVEISDFGRAEVIFSFSYPRLFSKNLAAFKKAGALKVLLRFEPAAVNPILYSDHSLRLYNRVLTIGGSEHIGVPKQVIHWPYFIHPNPAKPELTGILDSASASTSFPDNQKNRSIDVSMIVSNKVAWAVPSNYGLRRRLTLKALEHNLRVFGMGWQETRISKLRANLRMYTFFLSQGKIIHPQHIFENLYFSKLENVYSVADKFDILRESLYHLVIENSSTYVSEKLLDAFIGGAIPIYIGPDLSQYGIPSDCVVTPKGGIDGIIKVLQNLSGYDSTEMKRNITKFMNSEHALSPWKPTMVAKSIIRLCQ